MRSVQMFFGAKIYDFQNEKSQRQHQPAARLTDKPADIIKLPFQSKQDSFEQPAKMQPVAQAPEKPIDWGKFILSGLLIGIALLATDKTDNRK